MRRELGLLVLILAATTALAQAPMPAPEGMGAGPTPPPPMSASPNDPVGGVGVPTPGPSGGSVRSPNAPPPWNPLARPAPAATAPTAPPASPAGAVEAAAPGKAPATAQPAPAAPARSGMLPPPQPAPDEAYEYPSFVGVLLLLAMLGTVFTLAFLHLATVFRRQTLRAAALAAADPSALPGHARLLATLCGHFDAYELRLTTKPRDTHVPDEVFATIARGTLDPVFALLEARLLPPGQRVFPLLRARAAEAPVDAGAPSSPAAN